MASHGYFMINAISPLITIWLFNVANWTITILNRWIIIFIIFFMGLTIVRGYTTWFLGEYLEACTGNPCEPISINDGGCVNPAPFKQQRSVETSWALLVLRWDYSDMFHWGNCVRMIAQGFWPWLKWTCQNCGAPSSTNMGYIYT